jgi:hypothetical protein
VDHLTAVAAAKRLARVPEDVLVAAAAAGRGGAALAYPDLDHADGSERIFQQLQGQVEGPEFVDSAVPRRAVVAEDVLRPAEENGADAGPERSVGSILTVLAVFMT